MNFRHSRFHKLIDNFNDFENRSPSTHHYTPIIPNRPSPSMIDEKLTIKYKNPEMPQELNNLKELLDKKSAAPTELVENDKHKIKNSEKYEIQFELLDQKIDTFRSSVSPTSKPSMIQSPKGNFVFKKGRANIGDVISARCIGIQEYIPQNPNQIPKPPRTFLSLQGNRAELKSSVTSRTNRLRNGMNKSSSIKEIKKKDKISEISNSKNIFIKNSNTLKLSSTLNGRFEFYKKLSMTIEDTQINSNMGLSSANSDMKISTLNNESQGTLKFAKFKNGSSKLELYEIQMSSLFRDIEYEKKKGIIPETEDLSSFSTKMVSKDSFLTYLNDRSVRKSNAFAK